MSFAISFLGDHGRTAWQFFLTGSGQLSYVVDTSDLDCSSYSWQPVQLDDRQLATVKRAIEALPVHNLYPDIDRLVIVSFQDAGHWITRTCQPDDVRQLRQYLEEDVRKREQGTGFAPEPGPFAITPILTLPQQFPEKEKFLCTDNQRIRIRLESPVQPLSGFRLVERSRGPIVGSASLPAGAARLPMLNFPIGCQF